MIPGFASKTVSFLSALLLVLMSLSANVPAQQPGGTQQTITPNFKDADITQVIEAVSAVTGKTIIPDPRVRANVTILSPRPVTPSEFYELFQSVLQVHGFVAVQVGKVIKIIPDANAKQQASNDLPDNVSSTSDGFVTQVIQVKNVSAAQLVTVLRPLMSQQSGFMQAYMASNILILSDRASNIRRIERIIERIDRQSDAKVEAVKLENASASDVVSVINTLYAQQQGGEAGGMPLKIVADERSNRVFISGEPAARLRAKAVALDLDTPSQNGGNTQVHKLRFAVADDMVKSLKEHVQGIVQNSGQPGATNVAAARQASSDVVVTADKYNNAVIVTAPPKVMNSINQLIDQLDIRRPQVLVEAIIAEISEDKSAELGINAAIGPADAESGLVPLGLFNQSIGGTSLGQMAAGILGIKGNTTKTVTIAPDGTRTETETKDRTGASNLVSALPQGFTMGAGRIEDTGTNFVALLRAIRSDANTNVISTPSTVTMDNQEAQLKVTQEVPFLTGQYANTGGGTATNAGGSVNPFQTIQREEVGTILKVTPQISEDNVLRLKISIESSSLAQSSQGAVDLISNKRTIDTNVLVEDGGIVTLGGLMSDQSLKGEQRVPFLGRVPIIGLAFKTRNARAGKSTLMVFIRPKILRDGVQTTAETTFRYNDLREQQRKFDKRELLPLLPRKKLLLPPVPAPAIPQPVPAAPVPAATEPEKADGNAATTTPAQAAPEPSPSVETSNPATTPENASQPAQQ